MNVSPAKGEYRTQGRLERVLQAGWFAVTAETSPPDSADPAAVLSRAGCLKGLADAVNVLDGAGARAHLSPLATAARWFAMMKVFGAVSLSTTLTTTRGFNDEK